METETVIDRILEKFAEENGIYYEISAKSRDGETLARYTSTIEAQDVAGYAGLLDEQVLKMAIEDAQAKEYDDA